MDTSGCGPAFRVLRQLLLNWLNDATHFGNMCVPSAMRMRRQAHRRLHVCMAGRTAHARASCACAWCWLIVHAKGLVPAPFKHLHTRAGRARPQTCLLHGNLLSLHAFAQHMSALSAQGACPDRVQLLWQACRRAAAEHLALAVVQQQRAVPRDAESLGRAAAAEDARAARGRHAPPGSARHCCRRLLRAAGHRQAQHCGCCRVLSAACTSPSRTLLPPLAVLRCALPCRT